MIWQTTFGHCLYQSDLCSVKDNFLYRWLQFNSPGLQTVINKLRPEKPVLRYIYALTLSCKLTEGNIGLLGLGGAGVLHALLTANKQSVVAVELHQEVIEIAQRFFFLNKMTNLHIIHADANQFLLTNQQKFKHLLVDLADANYFPASCFNDHFFSLCLENLAEDGVLSLNIANSFEVAAINQWLKQDKHWGTVLFPISKTDNTVFLVSKKENLARLLYQAHHAKLLKQYYWDGQWGQIAYL